MNYDEIAADYLMVAPRFYHTTKLGTGGGAGLCPSNELSSHCEIDEIKRSRAWAKYYSGDCATPRPPYNFRDPDYQPEG